ncbi:MAG TPA: class I adenylate-forming enzyme family protein [Candidatus Binatia bacterium]|nr:class I adenylate-forming enzyme family protein [Candidatus Binatia bacterium]
MNVYSVLAESAKQWPETVVIVDGDRSLRYGELHAAVEAVAGEFQSAGVKPGDKLGLLFPNCAEFVVAFFAAHRLRAITVPMPAALSAAEVARLAEEIELDALCFDAKLEPSLPSGYERRPLSAIGRSGLAVCAHAATSSAERERLLKLDPAIIRFSSGTTATAKGIVISHRTLLERVRAQRSDLPIAEGGTVLWMQPLTMNFVSPVLFVSMGSCMILAGATDTGSLAELLRRHRIAQIYAAPLTYTMMVTEKSLSAEDLRNVKHFVSTSAALPLSTAEAFRRRFGREVVQYYGSGECARASSNWNEDISKRGSVGRPTGGYEFKLEGVPEGACGPEAVGELLVRGPGLFDAYYKPWRPKDEVLENGWFRTSDLARRDADGYYWIVGRTTDMINVAGVKVHPQRLEEILLRHPAVEEAVVYGAPDARFGEAPRAKIKVRSGMKATEREILDFANDGQNVFFMLRGVEFVSDIPKTATGKPRRGRVEN